MMHGIQARRTMWLCVGMAAAVLVGDSAAWGEVTEARIPVRFELAEPGYVTLVIEDESGRRVNNLVADTRFDAGEHTVYWDGYDVGQKQGEDDDFDVHRSRVEPGQYQVRGLVHDGLALEYQVSVQSPGDPPWHTPDRSGAWLADHTPPSDALYLPDGSPHGDQPQMLVSAPTGETGHSAMWLDMDGNKLWGGKIRGWRSGQATARDLGENASRAHYAYALVQSVHLYGLRDGADTTGEGGMYEHLLEFESPETDDEAEELHWLDALARRDMVVRDGLAAISYQQADRLVVLQLHDDQDGGPRQLEGIEIASPRGLAFDPQGRLHIVSGQEVVRFDRPDLRTGELGQPHTVVAEGLDDPARMIVDEQGRLFVADHGSSHQVKVFSAAGEHLRTIGQPGGPQFGRYDERGMGRPAGMALDDRGRLWVAELEYGPKRFSRWDAETGEFDRAWYGPPKYGGGGHIDPRDPTRFFYPSGLQGIEFELDWENDTSRPRSIYWRAGESFGRAPDASVYIDGHHFLVSNFYGPSYYHAPDNYVYRWDDEAGQARLVAAAGSMDRKGIRPFMSGHMEEDEALAAKFEPYEQEAGHITEVFVIWSDLNGDGVPQAEEVQFHVTPGRRYAKPVFNRDLSLVTSASLYVPPPARVTADGVPVWDLSQAEAFTEGYAGGGDLLRADDGTAIYAMSAYQQPRATRAFRDGELLWHINGWGGPGRPNPIAEHPGQLINAQRNIGFPFTPTEGEGGQMFILNGWQGSLYMITTDGLIVTDLGGDERTHPSLGPAEASPGLSIADLSFRTEHFWPAVTQMDDGTIHVMAGKESSSVFTLVGYESIRRIGPWSMRAAPDQLDGLAPVKVEPGEGRTVERSATVAMPDAAPSVDGDLADWADADWMSIQPRFDLEGAVQVHGQTLYAAWRTPEADLLSNDAAEGWQYAFATGGGLDVMLRTDRQSDANQPIAGDVRLFVTRLGDARDGRVLAVLFEQAGGDGRGEPVHYTSPVGEVRFDSVRDVSEHVELAQRDGHYELAVPLSVLGLDAVTPGTQTRGDLGVLRGDGSDTHGRFYWSNTAAQMTTDIPSEAALQPGRWGTWRFETSE